MAERKSLVFKTFKKYCKFKVHQPYECEKLLEKQKYPFLQNTREKILCREENCPVWKRLMEEGFD
jgi:hypothetical protein